MNYLVNSDFEGSNGWEIINTQYRAAYSTARSHSPDWSMRSGIINPVDNIYSFSDFRQWVAVPLDADTVTLGTWLYPLSGEAPAGPLPPKPSRGEALALQPEDYDVQYVLVLDQYQNVIDTLVWQRSNAGQWVYMEFDLSQYAGWYIALQFGVYNNGYGGITAMYVDDATLEVCR